MGMLYKRGNVWWIKYYRNGKNYRESTKTSIKMVAEKILKRREGEIAQGKIPSVLFEKVTFDELAQDFLQHYRITGRKSLDRAERSVNHLNKYFEGVRAPYITTPQINTYIEIRQDVAGFERSVQREDAAGHLEANIRYFSRSHRC